MSRKKTIAFWGVVFSAMAFFCWLVQGTARIAMKEADERERNPRAFIRIVEIKDTPEGVRCFAPAFYGNPPDPKSGITCVVVWEGRAK